MNDEERIYTEAEGDAKPDTPLTINPETLGYPPDYNPYQHQKKRIKAALKALDQAGEKLKEMGGCYEQFYDKGRSETVELLYLMLGECRRCLVEFYVEKM